MNLTANIIAVRSSKDIAGVKRDLSILRHEDKTNVNIYID